MYHTYLVESKEATKPVDLNIFWVRVRFEDRGSHVIFSPTFDREAFAEVFGDQAAEMMAEYNDLVGNAEQGGIPDPETAETIRRSMKVFGIDPEAVRQAREGARIEDFSKLKEAA